jgi:hypothetical protein
MGVRGHCAWGGSWVAGERLGVAGRAETLAEAKENGCRVGQPF